MMNEHERIAWLQSQLSKSRHLALDNGDDAAVVRAPAGAVVSVDCQVEGVHFRRSFADWRTLGRRAVVAALSDLAAMGAAPRAVFSSLVLPAEFGDADFKELARGILSAAAEVDVSVAGGNLSAGPCVMIDTTVVGEAPSGVITRSGANPGDTIYVRGFPGAAALGLHALLRECNGSELDAFIEAWRAPVTDFDYALNLVGVASAAIDISDGLVQDLRHLCEASGVSARLNRELLPCAPGYSDVASSLGLEAEQLSLYGGEAYRLLFTSPVPVAGACAIGHTHTRGPALVVDAGGLALEGGFDHFQPSDAS